jgi:hypothetical protein
MTTTPAGERTVSGPRFPISLRGATAAYTANANASTMMRRVPPGRHVLVARDPSASAGDESSWAPSTRCHPLPRTGTRSGTSPAYRTQ